MYDSAALRSSAERNFADLDIDSDGVLTKDDYVALAQRRLAGSGAAADSPAGKAVVEAFLATWAIHVAAMDADGDGRISKDEYVSSFESMVRTGTLAEVMAPMLRATFDLADQDGDGALAVKEFCSLWTRPDVDLTAVFTEADADGDGRISFAEYSTIRTRLLVGDVQS